MQEQLNALEAKSAQEGLEPNEARSPRWPPNDQQP